MAAGRWVYDYHQNRPVGQSSIYQKGFLMDQLQRVVGCCERCSKRASRYFLEKGIEVCNRCYLPSEDIQRDLHHPLPEDVREGYMLSDQAAAKFDRFRRNDQIVSLTLYEVFPDGGGWFHCRADGVRHGADFYIKPNGDVEFTR